MWENVTTYTVPTVNFHIGRRAEDYRYATGYHRQAAGLLRPPPPRAVAGGDRAGVARDLPALRVQAPTAKNFARPEQFGAKCFRARGTVNAK